MNNMIKQRKKNNVVFFVAVVIAIWFLLVSLLFVYGVRNLNEKKSLQYILDATSQRQASLNHHIESNLQVLRGVAIGLAEMDLSNSERMLRLLDKVNRSNSFVRMGLIGTNGIVDLVDFDGTVYTNIDFWNMDFFQTALEGEDGVSGMAPSPITGLDVNYYAVPVYQGGEIVSVLCAANTNDMLWDILNVSVFQGQGVFIIIDNTGSIVAPSTGLIDGIVDGDNITRILGFSTSEQTSFVETLAANESGNYAAKMSGKDIIVTNQPLKNNDWHVLGIIPREKIVSYYNQTATGTIVIVLAASLFFVLLLFWQKRMMNRNQKSLEMLAYTDMLTGASNQTKFLLDAEHLVADRGDRKYAVWSFDINKFNSINDVFGVPIADKVLKGVASVFTQQVPKYSAFCRISADLFAGLIPYREEQDLYDWSRQLWEKLEQQDVIPANKMRISSAIGFYCMEDYPEDHHDVSNMISRASVARKQAKEVARNEMCLFTNKMSDRLRWEVELEAGGWLALQHSEITFFLQPKVNIQKGYVVVGAEALARWRHPVHGWVSPAEFIPLFERSGFIVDLDRYIFKQACQWYATEYKQKSSEFQLAINVSRQSLQRTDFLEFYTRTKQQHAIKDGVLELEITESAVIDDYELFQYILTGLNNNGFMCSIDDFGSGYSSLNVLKNLTIDILKLDSVFLRDSVDTMREQTVISSCIQMAHQLGMRTVAEGVETSQQLAFLRSTCCDMVQGYYFSEPLSPLDFEQLIFATEGHLLSLVAE